MSWYRPTLVDRPEPAGDAVRADFEAQVHGALARLYDPPALEIHPLARLAAARAGDGRNRSTLGQTLRRGLIEAVDALKPALGRASDPRAARAHHLLTRRYVEGATIRAIQTELAVSRSGYFREHTRALEAVAALLWERWGLAERATATTRLRALGATATRPNNLAPELTSFVGREQEIDEVKRLLGQARLVTLTGAGGAGKTRLALRIAAELLDAYPDGVWVAELASLSDPSMVPRAVLIALGARDAADRSEMDTLADYLRARRLLLVLDNCEHLVEACAGLAEALLLRCPGVGLLVTSREVLRAAGEVAWRVPSLPTPGPDHPPSLEALVGYPAVRLFVDRARAVEPGFALTEVSGAAVAGICRRLDGIPLAIELAAARVRLLPVDQIAARLDDRFRLLTVGNRTGLPHHQTLRALVDWSHDLLEEPERALLRRLAVFAGGFTLEAAEQVCAFAPLEGDCVLDVLGSLVDRSLVVAFVEESGRYRLLETIRQYAEEKLVEAEEAETARARHARWCCALCEQASGAFRGPDQPAWLERLELELDNLRAALAWAETRPDPALGLRLLGSSLWFWFLHYHRREAGDRVDRLLQLDGDVPPPVRAAALRTRALCDGAARADREIGYRCAVESVAICREAGDGRGAGESLHALACLAAWLGRPDEARRVLDEAVILARGLGDEPLLSLLLASYGGLSLSETDVSLEAPLEEGKALAERLGDTICVAMACRGLAAIARARGDAPRAIALYREDLARCRALGDTVGVCIGLAHLGREHLALGESDRAAAMFREALAVMRESRHHGWDYQVLAVEGLARAEADRRPARAVRLLGAAEALRTRHWAGATTPPRGDEALREALRVRLGPDVFGASWDEGLAMTPEQAVVHALSGEAP